MTKRDRKKLLESFERNKRNRTLAEAEELLRLYGFIGRDAVKEGSFWKRGHVTLTLPTPKGRYLLVDYPVLVIRKIKLAERLKVPEEHPS